MKKVFRKLYIHSLGNICRIELVLRTHNVCMARTKMHAKSTSARYKARERCYLNVFSRQHKLKKALSPAAFFVLCLGSCSSFCESYLFALYAVFCYFTVVPCHFLLIINKKIIVMILFLSSYCLLLFLDILLYGRIKRNYKW